MKKRMILLSAAVIVWLAALANPAVPAEPKTDWKKYRMIAHAMGGIGGVSYTNSYEAFIVNYEKGHRVFEADLILTADGRLAARHDWLPYSAAMLQQDIPANRLGKKLTLEEFKSYPILNRYQPLVWADILRLLQLYPDIYIVTDTKEMDPGLVKQQFRQIKREAEALDSSLLDRIIPEIYTQEMYETVMDIHPFLHSMYSLYLNGEPPEETLRFVKERGIAAVAMPVERALAVPELVKGLEKAGVKTYVHTVNTEETMQEMLERGAYGVYTDFLDGQMQSQRQRRQ